MIARRSLLTQATAAGLATALPAHAASSTRLILLGTKGGPTPALLRSAPASLLLIEGKAHVVDCGNGVARQIVRAGVRLDDLAAIYVTHHHSDHNADLVTLPLLAWGSGLKTPVDLYGPQPLAEIVRLSLAANAPDIEARIREEGRPPLAPLLRPHEIGADPLLVDRPGLRVRCVRVDHYTIPAYAYRFDTPDRGIVFSGDTTYSPALIDLAKGADVLVHEAMYPEALRRIVDGNAPTLMAHLLRSHTTAEQAGKVAAEAGVKTLVLSHLVPAGPDITDSMWTAAARRHFSGRIVVGRDLVEVR